MPYDRHPPFVGIVGWKNSGKTTLTCAVIEELRQRGINVASIKHTHHKLQPGKSMSDSVRHGLAGAQPSILIGSDGWATNEQRQSTQFPSQAHILHAVEASDIVLVEGDKEAMHPKIEVRRRDALKTDFLAPHDARIFAVVADFHIADTPCATFKHEEIGVLCDALLAHVGTRNA